MRTVVADADGVARAAARVFARCVREAVDSRGTFSVALSGGSTPRRLYETLAAGTHEGALGRELWSRVHVFWGDERCVPPDHPDSNYRMVREALLDHVPVAPSLVHRIEAERDPDEAAARYEQTLRRVVTDVSGGVPVIDLVLLGLGADGHTASLFPDTPLLAERQRWVVAGWVPAVAASRVTMTLPVLAAGRLVLGLAAGSEKKDAVARLFGTPAAPAAPARLVTEAASHAEWIIDRAAS